MLILLAPDLCRHIMKTQNVTILKFLEDSSANSDEIMLSSITYAELIAGVLQTKHKEKHMVLVQAFCDRLDDIVAWDRKAVDCYTQIQMWSRASNTRLNMNDAMLAAHALSLNAQLLCLNRKSFSSIEGLKVLEVSA